MKIPFIISELAMENEISFFKKNGYLILESFLDKVQIEKIKESLIFMINEQLKKNGIQENKTLDEGLLALRKIDKKAAIKIYQASHRLFHLKKISSDPSIEKIGKKLLGSNNYLITGESLRYDPPFEDKLLIDWHQDYPFIQDSENSLVFWFPLRDMSPQGGGVKLIPGSHLQGIRKVKTQKDTNWIELCHPPKNKNTITPLLKKGDVLIMHTMLLHKSESNQSDQVRWTGQFRLGDLTHKKAIERHWTGGMLENIHFGEYHPEYLEEENESL